MAGFINEYTFDMLAREPFRIGRKAMRAPALKANICSDEINDSLIDYYAAVPTERRLSVLANHRRRTLPKNGVRIRFYGSVLYTELTLKEIFKYGDLFLLFRLATINGDVSGRYNTRTGRFISPLNATIPRPDEFIAALKGLVLWAYTAVTCDDSIVQPTNVSYHRVFEDEDARIEFLSLGNRLQRSYGTDSPSPRPLDLEKYENREISLNGYIRRLPERQKASERARELARSVGLELSEGETYVQPFVRRTWVLKEAEGNGGAKNRI